jgi:acetyl esterase/lipase
VSGRAWASNYLPAVDDAVRQPEAAPFYASAGQLAALPPTLMIVGAIQLFQI